MTDLQTVTVVSNPPTKTDVKKSIQDLTAVITTLQSLLDYPESVQKEVILSIPTLLKQAQATLLGVEKQLQQSETKLKGTQQIIPGANELQSLLDILPVGIIIAHDLQNKKMTINSKGLKLLNLPPDTILSKSVMGGIEKPFKVLRSGKEVPVDALMQYATTHRMDLRDIELEIQHADGNILNLLEYASPLYDEDGAVYGSVCVLVEISTRKSIEQRLTMQYHIARALAESNSINEAATQVLQMICETSGWEYGAFWRVEDDAVTLTNEGVWHAKFANLDQYAEAMQYSVLNGNDTNLPGIVFHSGQSLWLSNLGDFDSADAVEAEKVGLHSAFILPVRSGSKVIAILECLSNRNQIQDQNLTVMLNAICNQIGVFLERKLLEETLATRANQQHLLAEIGIALSTSLDYEKRLQTIVRMIVPDLADWCAIDIIDRSHTLQRVAVAHVDENKENLLYEIQPTRQVDFNRINTPQVETLLNGHSLLLTDIPSTLIEKTIVDTDQLEILRQLDPVSSIVVPLIAHNQILGICTFVHSDSRRHYLPSDLVLAEDIVRQAAQALDNALLYAESQKHNAELEHRVDERTTQLKVAIDKLTNQIVERQNAENQVKILNAELEKRINERTFQLEVTNRSLHKEVLGHQQTSLTLRNLLKRTRELYRISQTIGTVRTPNEILNVLLSSSYLKGVSRASIAILNKSWIKDDPPPENCLILAEWNRGHRQPRFINQQFTLEEYGISLPIPYNQPIVIVIADIQAEMNLPEHVRKRFADLRTHSLIILPLFAGGEWYGLLSLHFKTHRMTKMDDLHHVRGLVNETAIAIKNMRLLEAESQARLEAETANALKLKFLAMISHELRTPLASIKGFATTLLAKDVVWSPDKQRDFLQIIDGESDKLSDLIEQLLDLSRMEAGIMRISPKKILLSDILDSALPQLQALTTQHELILDIQSLPPIFADGQRIAQVLTNLVGNAAKFSPAETKIIISAYLSGKMVQVDVGDQGPGIPQKDRLHVFESFRQLENGVDNRAKGAGLGLAICKGLIETQNGKIWLQDRPDPGTVISFTLPLWK